MIRAAPANRSSVSSSLDLKDGDSQQRTRREPIHSPLHASIANTILLLLRPSSPLPPFALNNHPDQFSRPRIGANFPEARLL